MRISKYCFILVVAIMFVSNLSAQNWHDGTWDASVYNRSEHPKTVAVRIEIRDADTGLPLQGAQAELKGQYTEETIGPEAFDGTPKKALQKREFKMSAQTGTDGVTVFALAWQKRYPWETGYPGKYDIHTSWIRAMDDIEKVQTIEIRNSRYRETVIPFDFSRIIKVGPILSGGSQSAELVQVFENAWRAEIYKDNVRFCILNIGTRFPDFKNTRCLRTEFFETIRKKEYGTVLAEPQNYFSFGDYPQSECGPYFIYLLEVRLQKIVSQLEMLPPSTSNNRSP